MPYIANTDQDREQMLKQIGVNSIDDLFKDIPEHLRCKSFDVPPAQSEFEVKEMMQKLAHRNATDLTCFLGGGFYDHYIPAALNSIISRGEFYTSYTPYQPEVSQGTP